MNAGCCSCATCSSLLAKAATLFALTSPFMALKSRDRNMGDLPDLATSGCSSTAYNALQQDKTPSARQYTTYHRVAPAVDDCSRCAEDVHLEERLGNLPDLVTSGWFCTADSALSQQRMVPSQKREVNTYDGQFFVASRTLQNQDHTVLTSSACLGILDGVTNSVA